MSTPPVILVIGFVWPEITATAASQNIISYMKTLTAAQYPVHFASAASASDLTTDLNQWAVQTHAIELNNDSFDRWITQLQPDIVIFDRFLTEEQFGWRVARALPDALRVLDCEDLHFLRQARHRYYKASGYQPKHAQYLSSEFIIAPEQSSYLHNEITARELASIYRCDLTLTLSSFEAQLLTSHFAVRPQQVMCIPFIVDDTPVLLPSQREGFVSIGNFRHAPNIDAVNILIHHIWPKIRQQLPDANCYVYGAYMPPKIKAQHQPQNGLHMQGYAENHINVLSHACVLLAPLQFGAGVKGKLVDALRCSLPSVTTPIGVEGIDHETWPGAVTDNEESFVKAAVDCYQSQGPTIDDCEAIITRNFDSARNAQKLLDGLSDAFENRSKHRTENFMQQMVMHHSLQSHKYMSQWIAAKNANINKE
jgi:hypothetical protein